MVTGTGTGSAGRVTIAARAYERIGAVAAAEALGVPRREARAVVRDDAGALSVAITSGVSDSGDSVRERAERARTDAAERIGRLTGAAVSRVSIHLTHVISEEGRAR
jgi:hypothetical protein